MVSLAVLGLIAGLTVPSIVVAVDRSKTKNSIKEAFQTISSITQAGVLNGDFASITDWNVTTSTNPNGIVGYITSKLNYSKQCLTTDITSDGCKQGWPGTPSDSVYNKHNARWILPNGTKIQAAHVYTLNPPVITLAILAKPFSNTIVQTGNNADMLWINCNVTDTTQLYAGVTLKAGTCGAHAAGFWENQLNMFLGNT